MRFLSDVRGLLFRDRVIFGRTVLYDSPVDRVYALTISFASLMCVSQLPLEKLAYGAACSIVISSVVQ